MANRYDVYCTAGKYYIRDSKEDCLITGGMSRRQASRKCKQFNAAETIEG